MQALGAGGRAQRGVCARGACDGRGVGLDVDAAESGQAREALAGLGLPVGAVVADACRNRRRLGRRRGMGIARCACGRHCWSVGVGRASCADAGLYGARGAVAAWWARELGGDVGASIARRAWSAGDWRAGQAVLHVACRAGVAAEGRRLAGCRERIVGARSLGELIRAVVIRRTERALRSRGALEEPAVAYALAGGLVGRNDRGVSWAATVVDAGRSRRRDAVGRAVGDDSGLAIRVSGAVVAVDGVV